MKKSEKNEETYIGSTETGSQMILLQEITEVNVYSDRSPGKLAREVAVRADMIDMIEPDEYYASWAFTSNPNDEDLVNTLNAWPLLRYQHTYWSGTNAQPCVRVHVGGHDSKLVLGSVEGVKKLIDSAERPK